MEYQFQLPGSDPSELLRYRDGVYGSALLGAAITELDFFSRLAEQPMNLTALCASLGLAERPADVMITLFSAMGLIRQVHGKYSVTKLARKFLVAKSPFSLRPYFASMADRLDCRELITALRTGKPVGLPGVAAREPWATAMRCESFADDFTRMMHCRGLYHGPALARRLELGARRRLLDIGGGSGVYACSILAKHRLLTASVFEKPPVDEITRRYISEMGFAKRVDVVSGDMFAHPLPSGYDVHLFSNVLHDWPGETVKKLLRKSFSALSRDGMIAIHDSHINQKKTGPLTVAAYSVLLMASTEGKCYSISEIEKFLRGTGFTEFRCRETVADRSVITARKPKRTNAAQS
jgi:hypothetical protein